MWAGLFLLLVCSIIFGKRGAHFEDPNPDDAEQKQKLLGKEESS